MPQPRDRRGSSKVRVANCISHICRFPSPIKTHFFVFGCAESEKIFTSVGFSPIRKSARGIPRKICRRPSDGEFLSFAPPRFERKTLLFPGLSSRRRFPTADIGEYGKNEKGAVCFMHTAPFFTVAYQRAQKGFMPLPLRKLDAVRRKALCHRRIDIHRAVRKSLIIAP